MPLSAGPRIQPRAGQKHRHNFYGELLKPERRDETGSPCTAALLYRKRHSDVYFRALISFRSGFRFLFATFLLAELHPQLFLRWYSSSSLVVALCFVPTCPIQVAFRPKTDRDTANFALFRSFQSFIKPAVKSLPSDIQDLCNLYSRVHGTYLLRVMRRGPCWPSRLESSRWSALRRNIDFFGDEVITQPSGAGGQNRTGYARLFRAALYQ